jgi:hypothetical protein
MMPSSYIADMKHQIFDFRGDAQCGPVNYQPGLAEQVPFRNTNKTDNAYIVHFWKVVADFYSDDDFTLITEYAVDAENKTEPLDVVMTKVVSSPILT